MYQKVDTQILGTLWPFLKKTDALGVRALGIVINAPAMGGFGEVLGVDEDTDRPEAGCFSSVDDLLFKRDGGFAHFADFEGNVST